MTYDQLAAARGISKDSAVALVRRHHWRRQRDNRGHTLALVPAEAPELRRPPEPRGDYPPDDRGDATAFAAALSAIEAARAVETTALRDQIDAATRRADAVESERRGALELADRSMALLADAEARADRAEAAITGERKRADRAEYRADGLRSRVDELEVNLGAANAAARASQERADALARAEGARKVRGRWARLRAAWRGE
jgi:hypothetical protein